MQKDFLHFNVGMLLTAACQLHVPLSLSHARTSPSTRCTNTYVVTVLGICVMITVAVTE